MSRRRVYRPARGAGHASCRQIGYPPTGSRSNRTGSANSHETPTARPAPAAATRRNRTAVNQFSTEALAKARCPADTVVWVNLSSRIYHYAGNKDYGKTKRGAYMCEKDTAAANFRAAKNEKRPS